MLGTIQKASRLPLGHDTGGRVVTGEYRTKSLIEAARGAGEWFMAMRRSVDRQFVCLSGRQSDLVCACQLIDALHGVEQCQSLVVVGLGMPGAT